jgi:hypothetical protein
MNELFSVTSERFKLIGQKVHPRTAVAAAGHRRVGTDSSVTLPHANVSWQVITAVNVKELSSTQRNWWHTTHLRISVGEEDHRRRGTELPMTAFRYNDRNFVSGLQGAKKWPSIWTPYLKRPIQDTSSLAE